LGISEQQVSWAAVRRADFTRIAAKKVSRIVLDKHASFGIIVWSDPTGFQKKSKKGTATPKHDIDLVKERLKQARAHYVDWSKQQEG